VEKYGTARQATHYHIIRRMRFACWITKATDTHSECVILTYSFSTATVVTRTRLNVTLYVHCLSWYYCSVSLGKFHNSLPKYAIPIPLIFFPIDLIIAPMLYYKPPRQPRNFSLHKQQSVKTMRKIPL
jgi:hypothetical protein